MLLHRYAQWQVHLRCLIRLGGHLHPHTAQGQSEGNFRNQNKLHGEIRSTKYLLSQLSTPSLKDLREQDGPNDFNFSLRIIFVVSRLYLWCGADPLAPSRGSGRDTLLGLLIFIPKQTAPFWAPCGLEEQLWTGVDEKVPIMLQEQISVCINLVKIDLMCNRGGGKMQPCRYYSTRLRQ